MVFEEESFDGQKGFSSREKIDALIGKKEIDLNGAAYDVYLIEIKTKNDSTSPGFIRVRNKL